MNLGDESRYRLNRRAFLRRHARARGIRAAGVDVSRPPSLPARLSRTKAKAVICLFQHGGPSQMDLFDYKPELNKRSGQAYSGLLEVHFRPQVGKLLGSPYKFRKFGQSGMELSELLPHTGRIVDDI